MHPPLDRPHPRCQDAINNLRDCHANASKLQFWACNEVKTELDRCFRKEKEEMLKQLNANLDEKKKEEGEQAALAFGRTETFQEYLAKDKTYQREVEKERKRQQSWFSMF